MVDSKGSPQIPEDAAPKRPSDAASSGEPAARRDPVLEELLRSRSADSESAAGKSFKRRKTTKTGTSLDRKSRKSKLPLIALIVAGVVLVGGGGTATWFALAPAQSQIDPDRNKDKTQKVSAAKDSDPSDEIDAPWNKEDKVFPVPLDKWAQKSGVNGVSEEEQKQVLNSFLPTTLGIDAGTLPSEAAGFTSDDGQVTDAEGNLNPAYSYWTKESYTAEVGQIVEKFINPIFGNWEKYEYAGSNPQGIDPAAQFPATFTDELLNSKQPVQDWLPIYADWNNNDYGRNDFSSTGGRWYGELESSTSTFKYDEDSSQYTVEFTGDVKFTAYDKDGGKVSEKGTLKLELVANPSGERGLGGKVLVNRSSLTIGG